MGIKASARRLVKRIHARLKYAGWDELRNEGNSRLVKSCYVWLFVVPLVANILDPMPDKYRLPVWLDPGQQEISLALPFKWGVLYFAAFFFAVGQFVFALRCPSIVKRYANFHEFRSAHVGIGRLLNDMLEMGVRMRPREYEPFANTLSLVFRCDPEERGRLMKSARVASEGIGIADSMPSVFTEVITSVCARSTSDRDCGEFFDMVRAYASGQRTVARWIAGTCFLVGFVFLVVVVGQNTYAVWKMW